MRNPPNISREPRAGEIVCPECDGEGIIECEAAPRITAREEPDWIVRYCDHCEGEGVVPQEEME